MRGAVLHLSCQTCPGPAGPVSTVTTRRGKKQRPQMGAVVRALTVHSQQGAEFGATDCGPGVVCAGTARRMRRPDVPAVQGAPPALAPLVLPALQPPADCLPSDDLHTDRFAAKRCKECQSAALKHTQGNGLHPAARRVTYSSRLRNARPSPAAATPTPPAEKLAPLPHPQPPHPLTACHCKIALKGPAIAEFATWESS